MMYSISVIVPIYNVERYIERCAISLFKQTLASIEFIFINDCTPDNSMEVLRRILKQYPSRADHVRMISNERNLGVAISRDIGHFMARGEYVIDCDSDDWPEPEMYEQLYKQAKLNDSDIVICNWNNILNKDVQSTHIDFLYSNKDCIVTLLDGRSSGFLWYKFIKRNLYIDNKIRGIPEINCMEDLFLLFRLFFYAKKIDYVEDRLYNYNRQNINSSTYSTLSEKAQLGMQTLVSKVQDFFDALQILDLEYSSAIKNLEIRIYSILLLKGNLDESVWQKCFTFHLHDIWCHPSLPFYYKMSLSCAILRFKTLVRMIRYFYRAAIK